MGLNQLATHCPKATTLSCAGPDWKDAAKNTEMGSWVISRTRAFLAAGTLGFKLTNDDLEKAAIAAYNAGEGRVLKAIEQGRDSGSGPASRAPSLTQV